MLEVFTDEWAAACCRAIDASAQFRSAAAEWEDAVVLVMTADAGTGVPRERAYFLDLWRGRCRGVHAATPEEMRETPYVLAASPDAWRRILGGQLEPVAALMTGKLRLLRGNLFSLARHASAAKALVEAAGEVEAVFPGG